MASIYSYLVVTVILFINKQHIVDSAMCASTTFKNHLTFICTNKACVEQKILNCINEDHVFSDVSTVTIKDNIRRFHIGAFSNLPNLNSIIVNNMGLRGMNTFCFHNLPKFDVFLAHSNLIEEISWGVFTNSALSFINLERNSIYHMDSQAFGNMPNLKTLDLNRNRIAFIDSSWFTNTTSIEKLIVSNNLMTIVWFNTFQNFPNLKHLDLNFNKIHEVRYHSFNNLHHLDFLDLTNNELFGISEEIFDVENIMNITLNELRLGLNNITYIPKAFFEKIKLKKLILHPNPWHCDCLDDILAEARKGDIAVEEFNTSYPICAFPYDEITKCHYDYGKENNIIVDEYFTSVKYKDLIKTKYIPEERCPVKEYLY